MLAASAKQLLSVVSTGARLCCARNIHQSVALQAEPLKKKKKVDPQVEIERIRKKTRRIEKEIKRLEQRGRYLKPLEEIEGERHFVKTLDSRERKVDALPDEEVERRALLMKDWTRYKWQQLDRECRLLANQRSELYRAMEHLKTLDRTLFDAANEPDNALIGLSISGPLFSGPQPASAFDAADGDYRDITPSYRYVYEMDKKMTFNKKK